MEHALNPAQKVLLKLVKTAIHVDQTAYNAEIKILVIFVITSISYIKENVLKLAHQKLELTLKIIALIVVCKGLQTTPKAKISCCK